MVPLSVVFLAGRGIDLCPLEPGDGALLDLMPWVRPQDDSGGERIAFGVRSKEGALVGLARVDGIDWTRRSGSIALRWRPGAPGAEEALRLARDYALQELRLHVVTA